MSKKKDIDVASIAPNERGIKVGDNVFYIHCGILIAAEVVCGNPEEGRHYVYVKPLLNQGIPEKIINGKSWIILIDDVITKEEFGLIFGANSTRFKYQLDEAVIFRHTSNGFVEVGFIAGQGLSKRCNGSIREHYSVAKMGNRGKPDFSHITTDLDVNDIARIENYKDLFETEEK